MKARLTFREIELRGANKERILRFEQRKFSGHTKNVHDGTWRSLVARTLGVREVAGSNPVVPTKVKRLSASAESLFRFRIFSAKIFNFDLHFRALRAHRFGLARRLGRGCGARS